MKKVILLIGIFILMSSCLAVFSDGEDIINQCKYPLYINGARYLEKDYFILNDETVYIPLRKFCDFFNIPIHWDGEKQIISANYYERNKLCWDDESEFKPVIPDEETALEIGRFLLEKHTGRKMEFETEENEWFLKVSHADNTWLVFQTYRNKKTGVEFVLVSGDGARGVAFPAVIMLENTGEVISLYTDVDSRYVPPDYSY